jgi:hypothetical protein
MQSFYIKLHHDYCILHYSVIKSDILPLTHYLIDNGVITDINVLNAFKKLVQLTTNTHNQSYYFSYHVLNYRLAKTKNSANQNEEFSLDKIAHEYEKLSQLSQYYQLIINETKKHSKYLKTLTINHVKDRTNYLIELKNVCDKHFNQLGLQSFSHYKYHHAKSENDLDAYDEFNLAKEKAAKEAELSFLNSPLTFIIDFSNLFKNKFHQHFQRIGKILDNQGRPHHMVSDGIEDKFKEKKAYALFCQEEFRENVFGFFSSGNTSLTDINQAKLFQNEAHVERYIKQSGLNDLAIVQVNVKLDSIIKKVGDIDISNLETVKIAQEKESFEKLIEQEKMMEDVMYHLIEIYGEKQPLLKEELLKIIEAKSIKKNKKTKI